MASVMELMATLTLDTSEYDKNLNGAKTNASTMGNTLMGGLKTAAKVGGAALGVASGAAVAFTKSAVDSGMAFDSSMSQVAATMGKTTQEMESEVGTVDLAWGTFSGNLRDYAQEMGAKTSFSAKQAADALNYMALAGYDTQTSMETLPNVLNLAAAGSMDLATASDMVTDAGSALGLSIDETAQLVDKMAQASSKSNTSVSQLGNAILTVGGTAKNLAGGTTELSTALGILADNGVKGSEGGTALRNIILSLTAPTDKAAGALEELGVSAFDSEGKMRPLNETFNDLNIALSTMTQGEQTQALNKIFNKVDLKSVNALLANTGEDITGITDKIKQMGVDWGKTVDEVNTRNKGMFDPMTVEDYIGSIVDHIQLMAGQYEMSNEEIMQTLQDEYGMSGETAKQFFDIVQEGLEDNTTRWEELTGYIDDAGGAAQKMADTQLDNLSGDITLFQSALEGVYIAISDLVTPALREFVQFGTDGLSDLAVALKEDGLAGAIPVFTEFVAKGTQKLVESLPMFVEAGAQLLFAIAQGIVAALPSLLESLGGLLSTAIQFTSDTLNESMPGIGAIFDQAVSAISNAVELIKAIWAACGEELTFIASTVWGMITTVIQSGMAIIDGIIKLMTAVIKGDWSGAWDAIKQIISAAWNAIKSVVVGALASLGAVVKAGLNLIKSTFTSVLNAVKSVVTSAFNGVRSAFSSGLNAAKSVVTSVLDAIKSKFTSIFDGVKNTVRNAIDTVKSIMNFKWHLPHLSLPHISISGGFSLNPPSVPHFGISWNKKALRNAYLLDDATIFGERGGTLLGGGEAGSEMIIGTGLLQGMIDESVHDATVDDMTADSRILKEILMLLRRYVPEMANMQLVTDTGALVGQLAPAMDAQLGVIARRRSYA